MTAVSYRHEFVFLHPLKTGGTSIETALGNVLEPPDVVTLLEDSFGEEVRQTESLGFGRHDNLQLVADALGDAILDFHVVVSARHPYQVLASLWRYSIRELQQSLGYLGLRAADVSAMNPQDGRDDWPFAFSPIRHLVTALNSGGGWPEWLRLTLRDEEVLDALVPTRLLQPLTPDHLLSDRVSVLHQESLRGDWSVFCHRHLGLADVPLPRTNSTIGDHRIPPHTSVYSYDRASMMLVESAFGHEIQAFDYRLS